MPSLIRLMTSIAALGLTAGCVTTAPEKPAPATRAPTLETYLQYAGPPIERFTYLGRYDGFRTLGGKDVVIWTTINDAYLIRVRDPCIELPFANNVRLTSTANTVTRDFDAVLVGHDRCRIDTIRRVDYLAMKKAHLAGP